MLDGFPRENGVSKFEIGWSWTLGGDPLLAGVNDGQWSSPDPESSVSSGFLKP